MMKMRRPLFAVWLRLIPTACPSPAMMDIRWRYTAKWLVTNIYVQCMIENGAPIFRSISLDPGLVSRMCLEPSLCRMGCCAHQSLANLAQIPLALLKSKSFSHRFSFMGLSSSHTSLQHAKFVMQARIRAAFQIESCRQKRLVAICTRFLNGCLSATWRVHKVSLTSPSRLNIAILQGDKKQASSGARLGGNCIRSKRGTPAWGVVLWVFVSVSHAYKHIGINLHSRALSNSLK